MGKLFRFFAGKLAVGGTARFVANGYNYFKNESKSRKDIFKSIVQSRFRILKNKTEEHEMIKRCEYLTNLTDLTFSILQVEGVVRPETPLHRQFEITGVIMQELRKKGIPKELINGLD